MRLGRGGDPHWNRRSSFSLFWRDGLLITDPRRTAMENEPEETSGCQQTKTKKQNDKFSSHGWSWVKGLRRCMVAWCYMGPWLVRDRYRGRFGPDNLWCG